MKNHILVQAKSATQLIKFIHFFTLLAISLAVIGCKKEDETIPPVDKTIVLTEFSPGTGNPGSSISLFGSNFPANAENLQVTFTSSQQTFVAPIKESSSTSITTRVPADASAGQYFVTVIVDNREYTYDATFDVTIPALKIISVSDTLMRQGDAFTIATENLDHPDMVLLFNENVEAALEIKGFEDQEIVVTVPDDFATGTYRLLVDNSEIVAVLDQQITVLEKLAITGFSPKEVYPGQSVTLQVTGFTGITLEDIDIKIINEDLQTAVEVVSMEKDEIIVKMPSAPEGALFAFEIAVENLLLLSEEQILYPNYNAPEIATGTASKAAAGEELIIKGQNFGTVAEVIEVILSSAEGEIVLKDGITAVAANEITITLPANLSLGDYKMAVRRSEKTSAKVDLEIIMPEPEISSFSNNKVWPEEQLVISGKFFGDNKTSSKVQFKNTTTEAVFEGTIKAIVNTSIDVTIPVMPAGKYEVIFSNAHYTISASAQITLRENNGSLIISDFTPDEVRIGEVLTISGAGFANETYQLELSFIGDNAANTGSFIIDANRDNQITFEVDRIATDLKADEYQLEVAYLTQSGEPTGISFLFEDKKLAIK